jgi:hypothetical protein
MNRVYQLLRRRCGTMVLAATVISGGCSLIASQKNADQCRSNRDCSAFPQATCDMAQNVCVSPIVPADAAGGGGAGGGGGSEGGTCWAPRGDASCFTCRAQTENELLNACSSFTSCEPFSNTDRIAGFEIGQPLRPPIPIGNPIFDAGTPPDAGSGTDAGRPPSTNARCSDLVPPPLYLMASSAFTLILRTFAQALASEVTLVYKYDTSCPSLDAILTGDTKIRGTAVYWSGDRELQCDVEQPIVAQIGGCDVAPEACVAGYTGSPNLVDEPGPIQVFMFTVPRASTQTSISAEAAYNVWGFGAESGVPPWETPNLIYKRFFDSGVQQVISATIRLPMNAWRGIPIKGSSEMKPALLASGEPEKTIGITSADQADAQDARANLRTLAYQHYDQNCGYLPDSTPGSFDKKNVRDGHYTLWAPYHFYSRKSDRMNDERIANVINYFTGAKRLPNPNTDLITTLKQGGLVPSCAMRVEREKEGAVIRPYKPSPSCGCYYDITSPGGYSPPECASCRTDRDCPVERPICSFGYCEPD